ncbi:MAG: DUF6790 family protein [bacterium]
MLSLIYLGSAFLVAFIFWAASPTRRTARGFLETLLASLFFFCVGLQGLLAAYAHTFRAAETAKLIGWAPGSPFQFEIGMANLALGIVGVLCLKFRGLFWLATAIFNAVLLWGCAYGHVVQQRLGDSAPYNTGVFLWVGDVVVPSLILGLSCLLLLERD